MAPRGKKKTQARDMRTAWAIVPLLTALKSNPPMDGGAEMVSGSVRRVEEAKAEEEDKEGDGKEDEPPEPPAGEP